MGRIKIFSKTMENTIESDVIIITGKSIIYRGGQVSLSEDIERIQLLGRDVKIEHCSILGDVFMEGNIDSGKVDSSLFCFGSIENCDSNRVTDFNEELAERFFDEIKDTFALDFEDEERLIIKLEGEFKSVIVERTLPQIFGADLRGDVSGLYVSGSLYLKGSAKTLTSRGYGLYCEK